MRSTRLAPWLALVPLLAACSGEEAVPTGPAADVSAAIAGIAACRNTDTVRLQEAYARIKKYPSKEVMPLVLAELEGSADPRRRAAIHALGMLVWDDPKAAFAPLTKLLANPDPFTRGPAAMALGSLGDAAAMAPILAMVKSDKDAYARRCAAWALGELGDDEAVEELKAVQDDDPDVQLYIEDALHRLAFKSAHKNDEGETLAAVRAVDLIAGSTKDQAERIERGMASLRKLDAAATKKLLTSWKAAKNHPKIAEAADFALKNFDAKGG